MTDPAPLIRRPYRSLDAWRGLAALLIVLHHGSSSITVHEPAVASDPVHVVCWYSYIGVSMFFVISGYCIANAADITLRRGQSVFAYARARIQRIYPTYWIALAVWIGMNPLFQFLLRHHIVPTSVAATPIHYTPLFWFTNLTLLGPYFNFANAVGQAWTLNYEISFYAIVGIALLIATFSGRQSAVMLWPLHALTLALIGISIFNPTILPFPLDLYPHFGLGVLVYDWLIHRRRSVAIAFSVAVLLLGTHIARVNIDIGLNPYPSRVIHLAAVIFAIALLLLWRFDELLSQTWLVRSFAIVGGFSYTLYLMHFYIVGAESQVLLRKSFFLTHHYVTLLITVAVALILCWLFYQVAERPFLKRRRPTSGELPPAIGVLPPSDMTTAPAPA